MHQLKLTLPALPNKKGHPAPCFTHRHRIGNGRMYDQDARQKQIVRSIIFGQCQAAGWTSENDGPIAITLTAFFQPVKSERKNAVMLAPYTKKPDIDNIAKFYLDCMTGIVYDDDRFIYSLQSEKRYGEQARVEITVRM